jgi:hypothetical protein
LPPLQLKESACRLVKSYNPFKKTPREPKNRHFSYERAPAFSERTSEGNEIIEQSDTKQVLSPKGYTNANIEVLKIVDEKNLALLEDNKLNKCNTETEKPSEVEHQVTEKELETHKANKEDNEVHNQPKNTKNIEEVLSLEVRVVS